MWTPLGQELQVAFRGNDWIWQYQYARKGVQNCLAGAVIPYENGRDILWLVGVMDNFCEMLVLEDKLIEHMQGLA